MKSKLTFIWALMLLITIASASALTITENFASLPNPLDWTFYNSTNCTATLDSGTLLINASSISGANDYCQYILNTEINMSNDVTIQWRMKTNADSEGGFGIGQDPSLDKGWQQDVVADYCGFAWVAQFEKHYRVYHNPANEVFLTTPTINQDSNWHDIKIDWDASIGNVSYYYDDVLKNEVHISSNICENVTNATIAFGVEDDQTDAHQEVWFDAIAITATAGGGESTCTGLCASNETFDYSDSICNHGWTAGDCTDLNTPVNNRYVCNESAQTIAHYFPYMTSLSGILTIQYQLDIDSDYDIIVGVGDQSQTPALYFWYDNGTIYKEQTSTSIGTYTVGTVTNYKILIDLQSQTYDFYIDGTATATDQAFANSVDHLTYIFFQPDLVKGYPYCDYTLDNVATSRGLAVVSGENVNLNSTLGRCIHADPLNASFNYDCCKENEHPQFCVIRVGFEEITGVLSGFFFNNFLLFLFLIVVIIIIVFVNKANSDGMTIINRK